MSKITNILLLWCLVAINLCIVESTSNAKIIYVSDPIVAGIGDDVELKCTVENVQDKTVSWAKYSAEPESETPSSSVVLSMRGMLSLSDSRYAINVTEEKEDNKVTYCFKITKAEANDMGEYECQVIVSTTEKITQRVLVSIKQPPTISEERTPKSTLVTEGHNLEVTCRAMGFPKPTVYWSRENNAIMPAGVQTSDGHTLRVKQVHRLDRGNYWCNAHNGVSPPGKRLVRIEVEFRPEISTPRPKVAQMPSNSVKLECKVQAYPAPAVFWHRNGSRLQANSNYEISNMASAHETTTSILEIIRVSESDYGDYYCNATNKLGHADARLNLFQPVIPVKY